MRSVSPSERGMPSGIASASTLQPNILPAFRGTSGGLLPSEAGGEEPYRPVRNGSLRELLDEEFSRNYRFEGFSDFIHDLKGLLRKVVVREDEDEEYGEFLAGSQDPPS